MIDNLMVRKIDRTLLKDVEVISSEECVPQYRMVIGRLVMTMKPHKKIVWKLKYKNTTRMFTGVIACKYADVKNCQFPEVVTDER